MEVGLGPGHTVLDGDPATSQKGHTSPHFSAYVYCGQSAGEIKMPLGTEVRIDPGHIALDEDPAPPKKGHSPTPILDPCMSVVAKWLDGSRCHLVYGGRPRPKPRCVTWGTSPPPNKRGGGSQQPSPDFRPMSIVAKQPDGSRCQLVRR